MSEASPVLLWDIDGTLLAAGSGGLEHYYRALRDVVPDAPAPELSTHGKTDWQVIRELLTVARLPLSHAEGISDRLDRLATVFLGQEKLAVLPGVAEALGHFVKRGITNGLLTGNSEIRARHKLGGAGLDLSLIDWGNSFFGSRAARRAEIAVAARVRHPRRKLLIIGDTPFDGHAAAEAGIPFLAVCTGKYACSEFEEVETVAVIDVLDTSPIEHALSRITAGTLTT